MFDVDLVAGLDAYAVETLGGDRGDEDLAHVSDLYGCDRATWARRKGLPMLPFDGPTARKFLLGHAVEAHVLDALEKFHGKHIERNRRIGIRLQGGNIVGRVLAEDEEPAEDEMVGHLDGESDTHVIEVKSTGNKKMPSEDSVSEHYHIQTAGYALARGKRYMLAIVCTSTGEMVVYEYDPEESRDLITERIGDVLLFTSPDQEQPPAQPMFGWQCSYCRVVSCEKRRSK